MAGFSTTDAFSPGEDTMLGVTAVEESGPSVISESSSTAFRMICMLFMAFGFSGVIFQVRKVGFFVHTKV
jgi:hypothetical protein